MFSIREIWNCFVTPKKKSWMSLPSPSIYHFDQFWKTNKKYKRRDLIRHWLSNEMFDFLVMLTKWIFAVFSWWNSAQSTTRPECVVRKSFVVICKEDWPVELWPCCADLNEKIYSFVSNSIKNKTFCLLIDSTEIMRSILSSSIW